VTIAPGPVGPEEFADEIIRFQSEHPAPDNSGEKYHREVISPEGLKRLIVMAYHAGLMPEEGRFPRFRLIVSDSRTKEISPVESAWTTAHFASPVPLGDPDAIRRLAPAVPLGEFGLNVKEQDGMLACTGCCVLHRPSASGALPEYDRPLDSIMVRVDGPGRMRVSGPFPTFLYKAGRIAVLRRFIDVPCAAQWLTELTSTLVAGLTMSFEASAARNPGAALVDGVLDAGVVSRIQFSVQYVWSCVLGTAVDLGHGGTFVVLPSVPVDPSTAQEFRCITLPAIPDPPIECKYQAARIGGLGDELKSYWLNEIPSAEQIAFKSAGDVWSHRQNWMNRKVELGAKARAFGNFSAVDGCVVLDRGMKLIGFGGEIRVDDAMLKQSPRIFFDPRTNTPIAEEELRQFGTRHRSAFRLCKMVGGAIVFVVSQDGELRVFSSDADHVYFDNHLSHVILRADHC
jgi:hypothetical protein